MVFKRFSLTAAAIAACSLLVFSACSGSSSGLVPSAGSQPSGFTPAGGEAGPFASDQDRGTPATDTDVDGTGSDVLSSDTFDGKSKIKFSPSSASVLGIGPSTALKLTATEKGASFTISTTACKKFLTVKPTKGKSPLKLTLTGKKIGSCSLTFNDNKGNSVKLKASVTTTTLALAGPLPSAASANVTITPGGTVNVAVPSCATAAGCSINVPAKAGTDTFAVTILDSAKKTLAVTAAAVSGKITAAKANKVSIPLVRTIASLAWGTIPAGTAGTAFAAPQALTLTAKDADSNTITGTYASAVTLTDSDKSGATTLAPASVTSSSTAITLNYNGGAIGSASLTASATGVTPAVGTFSVSGATIVYTGAKVSGNPEIDLYSNTPATAGYSGAFTATEAGYSAPFTYTFAAISGQTNNCPGTGSAQYTTSPASGAAGTSFTVSSTSANNAGECLMTISGGGGATLNVILTYTTSSIGVNGKKHHPPH